MQVYPADFNIEKAIDKSKMRFSQFNEGTIHATKICELFHLSLQLIKLSLLEGVDLNADNFK